MDQTLLLLQGSQILAWGVKIPYAAQHSFKKKKKDVSYNEKLVKEFCFICCYEENCVFDLVLQHSGYP